MLFKDELLEFRAKFDLTQKQAAKILGVNPNMIFRYEKGFAKPSDKNLIILRKKMYQYEK